ncbi:uncharacterized protein spata13 isoform X4 [Pseudoliparis swirei]|uniref:uncharacterized protein spata13 isoform X4 n=1 Tax=Pseudoliparis swirei TaxID=2059687 RepID=UPI0024BDED53|nr:uncharacterized protein spata13 isoform X4 [Pseudoliparis swirei]
MSREEQQDRVSSTSEDSLPGLHSSKADPLIRSRPLSDVYPFHSHADGSVAPCRPSGFGAQVQPVTAGPHENRLNDINSSSWSNPVIGQPEGKPYSSRIMRLFSNSRKAPVAAHSSPTDGPASTHSNTSVPQSLAGLSGLGVDSFKKLRSSVLQGIQSRGAVSQDGDHDPSDQEVANGTGVADIDRDPDDAEHHLKCAGGYSVSNGNFDCQVLSGMSHCGSDIEDYDDEEHDEGDGLLRNTRFSRSIRRAYGAGRISLLDTENRSIAGSGTNETTDGRKPDPTSVIDVQTKNANENTNVPVLSRLSRSADNLHIFKAPFRRKVSSPGPTLLQEEPQRASTSNGTPNIQRTASTSSVDFRGHAVGSVKGPAMAKGSMLKLVGSMTDLTVRRRRSPSPSPIAPSLLSPLTRLHDDYSRRVPCLTTSERQRRPSPVRARVTSVGRSPAVHPRPGDNDGLQQHRVLISPVSVEAPEGPEQTHYEPPTEATTSGDKQTAQCDSAPLSQKEHPQQQDQTKVSVPPNELKPSGSKCSTMDTGPWTASRTTRKHRINKSQKHFSKQRTSLQQPAAPLLFLLHASRRRPHLPQMHPRKHSSSSPGEGVDAPDLVPSLTTGSSTPGSTLFQRKWPNCVPKKGQLIQHRIKTAVGLLSRPPIPSHQVPPYRAVSARFRPSALSQSTPIGLDGVGRRQLHRVLSVGVSECSATLDDSVSEEEEGSFDAPPYLQPGVELSVLNEWISSGHKVYAEALWDHVTMEEQELAFKAGDVIRVLDASHNDWWWGRGADKEAWFPSSFVRVRVNQEDSSAESVESVADQEDPAPRDTHSVEHKEQMRTNVVQEIMNTERIYIKHLKDICEGYIRQCRKHPDMFTELQLKTIFSNIEDIYRFQRQFLKDLEKKYNKDQPHLSEIGSCFLLQGEGFAIYSNYCNTHPAACAELQRLMKSGKYKHFFEACRLLQQMINISIAGFLLTPVQKICKYPLQLGELLKYTPKDHSDHSGVSKAYEAMKNVASLINESKRRLESFDTIAHWQVAILHWEGPDVLERSSELIHSGELTRVVRQGKMQQRSFFLFDHQLVFCKKDVLRRDLLHYRGRLDMDQTEVLDVADGRDQDLGLTLRNAVRLRHASTLEFVCVLCCRKAQDKQRWLQAFAKERYRVKEDQEMGMEISEEQRKQAIVNARRAKQKKSKNIGYSGSVPPHHQNLHPLHQRHITIPTSVPQQQVFSLAEPPKRKPYHMLYNITSKAFFRK